jgi:hypothetical protein
MASNRIVDDLRVDCQRLLERPPGAAPAERFWEWSELIKFIVEHVVIAGSVSFLSKVASEMFLQWWRDRRKRLEQVLPAAGQDPTEQQLQAAEQVLRGADDRVEEELGRLTGFPSADQIREAQREIAKTLVSHNFDETHASWIAGEIARTMADRIGKGTAGPTAEKNPPTA